jgi:LPS export ABC transporter protein LptC
MIKNYALIIAAALLTVGFLLVWDSPPESFLKKSEGLPEEMPLADSYMRKVSTRVFSLDGQVQFSLDAPEIKFFRNVFEISVLDPIVISQKNSGRKVEISAKSGVLNQISHQIELVGNVHITAGLGSDIAKLETAKLTYFPDDGLVESDRDFEFESIRGKVYGTGIEAYPDKGRYNFLAQVQGIYEYL